jgi:succinate dehydrogenase/fumarate reductase flavoprotein subunit
LSLTETLENTISTDILVVGGGISGLSAAIAAKEAAPELNVLVVDRATGSTGWAGKAPRTAGHFTFVTPEDDPEDFIKYIVCNIGCFLNDQLLLREYAYATRKLIMQLKLWGVTIVSRPDGKIQYNKIGPFPWGTTLADLDMCARMATYAKRLGVKFLDKVFIADLLKSDEQVTGAVGFSLLDGTFYIFKAGATILACGNQNYGLMPLWNGIGSGILAAYRAGAEMRNAEFGNYGGGFLNADVPQSGDWLVTGQDFLYNAKKEYLTPKYRPGPRPDSDPESYFAWYKETLAGNGPIYVDALTSISDNQRKFFFALPGMRPLADEFWKNLIMKSIAVRKDPMAKFIRVVHAFQGEISCLKVDNYSTSLPGLFAVGDISFGGSALYGAVPSPPGRIKGSGLMNAVFSGVKGGSNAAFYARALKAAKIEPQVNYSQVKELRERVLTPLSRENGIPPSEVMYRVQEVIYPLDYSIIKSGDRLKEALDKVLALREDLGRMKAKDYHQLCKCMFAESMALCAEMFYRASLMRTESRGFHYREDYPKLDNKNWLKWIIIKREDEAMKLYTQPIPIEKYPYKPPED